jgi:hypothetical protein
MTENLIMPEKNPFKKIESEGKVPEHLKDALVAEIETIRNTSVIVELFVGSFINTLIKAVDDNQTK